MQARYYDPVIGRFYSNDPVGAVAHLGTANGIHGFNRYAYANNNPYKYTDPSGENPVCFTPLSAVGCAIVAIGAYIAADNISDGTDKIGETGDALRKRRDAVNDRLASIADHIDSSGSSTTGTEINELGAEVGKATNEAADKIKNELPEGIKKVAGSIPGTTNSGTVPTTATDAVITGTTNIVTNDISEKDKTNER